MLKNFFKLLGEMEYKPKKMKDSKEEYFIYKPNFLKNRIKKDKNKSTKDNPFGKLSELRFN